jgi:hypothetical protein
MQNPSAGVGRYSWLSHFFLYSAPAIFHRRPDTRRAQGMIVHRQSGTDNSSRISYS